MLAMGLWDVPDVFERLAARLDPQSDLWRAVHLVQGASMWYLSLADCERVDLRGKNALITGGNIGIGRYTVEHLVARGCNVVIACREHAPNEPSKEDVIASLSKLKRYSEQTVEVWQLDCASLVSVKALGQRYLNSGRPLHYLINNAGICIPKISITDEKFERHWVINYLSHFTLTLMLLPALKMADKARIVQASSCFHYFGGQIDWAKLNSLEAEKWQSLDPMLLKYGRSKLALAMFGAELNERLKAIAPHIVVHSLHPGSIYSNMWSAQFTWQAPVRTGAMWLAGQASMSPKRGCKSMVKALLSEECERGSRGGRYWNRGWEVSPRPEVHDVAARKKLWDMSMASSGLSRTLV